MGFPDGSVIKNLPTMQETWIWFLGWEDPLEKEMATHSSIVAWRIPGTGSLVGCHLWARNESDTTERLHFLSFFLCLCLRWPWRRRWHPTPALLPGKSHGQRSLVDYSPWGCKELDTTEQLHLSSKK